eukprot:6228724-Amphidinium_carterae.2
MYFSPHGVSQILAFGFSLTVNRACWLDTPLSKHKNVHGCGGGAQRSGHKLDLVQATLREQVR